ncbi:uncharacterized protein [Euphorbia lathyris]|uniref:uncharacterized protein n=1 Tax=Euphorbia lathyris TaxID=212925 RepID=UPI003313DD77
MGSPLGTVEMDVEMGFIRTNLFKSAMRGEWDKVVETYHDNPRAYAAKITKAGDTALHLAVRDGQDQVVEKLVNIMSAHPFEAKQALKMANDEGNTALHIAAAVGNVRMCYFIAKFDPSLVGARNHENETPFFFTALYGKTDAFLCLHTLVGLTAARSYYRRGTDGDTILHVAIIGEYFELAFQIIYLYEELVNSFNQRGESPLHLLATKPNAFRSGTHVAGYHRLIYYCIFLDELKAVEMYESNEAPYVVLASSINNKKPFFPQNYQTCTSFFELPNKAYALAKRWAQNWGELPADTENQKIRTRSRHLLIPPNYDTCFDIFKFVSKAMLVILGLGSLEIKKLRDKKEKHTWCVQIMEEVLQRAVMYEYEHTGKSPQLTIPNDEVPYTFGIGGEIQHNMDIWDQTQHNNIDNKLNQQPENSTEFLDTGDHNKMAKKETLVLYPEKKGVSQVVEKILEYYPLLREKNLDRDNIVLMATEKPETVKTAMKESPILLAAKNGITEIVEKILEKFPVAIHDINSEKKNIVLLAVENRQPHVYQLLLERKVMKDSIFRRTDKEGNSALHLAARLGNYKPWRIPGAALQMQWEIKWYEFVKNSMPHNFFSRYNHHSQTAKDIFTETHKELLQSGGEWLTHTSESCSVVAALIATVAFATSSTVPGGVDEKKGTPTLEKQPAFNAFAIASLVALCFSVTAVVMFLAILTSRYQEKDFGKILPRRLLVGLTSLFISIAAILVSFCAGHFFVLKDELKFAAFPVYAVTCLPVTFFAIAQFPLYFDLVWATIKKIPQRGYMVVY